MARKRKNKTDPALLGRWILALGIILVTMTALALALRDWPEAPDDPATPPTLAPNPYGAADFGYDGDFLTCLSGESHIGIDVSSHQGRIDWEKVADAGVEFVFVRLGYRGYMNEAIHEDTYAKANLAGAKAAGLLVGAYFFSQATSEAEAKEEARFARSVLDGFQLDLPLVYDWEYVSDTARTANVTKDELMRYTKVFCDAVEAAGCRPMIYFNRYLAESHLELTELAAYPFWLAMYTDQMTYPHRVDCWQYSDSGRVPGIEANVDLNIWMPRNEV
jgi:GH25 family lysozyme M1 (1,4-beta-N-acetylmuramidase)